MRGRRPTNLDDPAATTDEKVKVDASDAVAEYLEDKLQEGTDVSITKVDVGGTKYLQISVSGTLVDDKKVKVSDNDTTPGFLSDKLSEGSNIVLAITGEGADEIFTELFQVCGVAF